jgi:hypothetical protein
MGVKFDLAVTGIFPELDKIQLHKPIYLKIKNSVASK